MLHLTEISKSFGSQVILNRAGLHVKPDMRIGLVGRNGAGKTTLLRLIAGELSLDAGEISSRKDLRIGFLPQEIETIADHSVLEEVLSSHADVLASERRLEELGGRLAGLYACPASDQASADPSSARLLAEIGSLQTAFEAAGGYSLEAEAQSILRGVGFRESDFHRPIAELSGGWRMRVALARLLLERPDLLLMDEPTNHLDLESLIWVEEFLLGWPGSLILVSHDRYFLDRLVTHIVELDRGGLDLYAGNYGRFEKERRQRYESLASAARNQQREIEQAESFIRRFRAKQTKARQVQQKIRQLERMERVEAPELEPKTISFRFPQPGRTGRVTAEMKRVSRAYGDVQVYCGLDLTIERGEKIALVGPNGAGKSTLLKLLAGVITPDSGTVKMGYKVRREYFAQHQLEVLDPARTVLKTMEEAAGRVDRLTESRSFLGAFLFSGDDVDKQVGVLSGGEKARLALARMLVDPAGLLLLDEPTNHLDMDSREVVTEALRQFEGSIVFISHDRNLINAVATKVVEVRDGKLTHFLGDWEYYQWKRRKTGQDSRVGEPASAHREEAGDRLRPGGGYAAGTGVQAADRSAGGVDKTATGRSAANEHPAGPDEESPVRISYEERKEIYRRHRKVEKKILALEARQDELARLLSAPEHASDYQLLVEASDEATQVRDELDRLYPEWERVAELVARLDSGR